MRGPFSRADAGFGAEANLMRVVELFLWCFFTFFLFSSYSLIIFEKLCFGSCCLIVLQLEAKCCYTRLVLYLATPSVRVRVVVVQPKVQDASHIRQHFDTRFQARGGPSKQDVIETLRTWFICTASLSAVSAVFQIRS